MIPAFYSFFAYDFCIFFLSATVQYLEIGIVYAVWSGATISITTFTGIIFFNESKTVQKLCSIFLVTIGVILLHGSHP
ncbi:MAG: hypothetical protein K9L17_01645 [Clostridiales bacterium]|nr:hypothetical protein [Clostridiales bacterium]MCF8021395.1 hypothetical protein [Clostridiales bacterium]